MADLFAQALLLAARLHISCTLCNLQHQNPLTRPTQRRQNRWRIPRESGGSSCEMGNTRVSGTTKFQGSSRTGRNPWRRVGLQERPTALKSNSKPKLLMRRKERSMSHSMPLFKKALTMHLQNGTGYFLVVSVEVGEPAWLQSSEPVHFYQNARKVSRSKGSKYHHRRICHRY